MTYTVTTNAITIHNEGSDASPVTIDDIVTNASAAVTKTSTDNYYIDRNIILTGTTVVEFAKANITIDAKNQSPTLSIATTAKMKLGKIDGNENTYDGVSLNVFNTNTNVFSTGGAAGDFEAYDSRISMRNASGVSFCFWRLYRSTSHVVKLIDCIIEGFSGTGRLQGLTLRNTQIVNATLGTVIPITTKAPTVEIDGLSVRRSNNFFYWHQQLSGDITVRNLKSRDNNSDRISIVSTNGNTATFIDPDLEGDLSFASTAPNGGSNGAVELKYSYNATVVQNSDSANVQDARMAFFDIDGTEEYNDISNASGVFSEALLTGDLYVSSSPTAKTPHTLRVRKAGFQYIDQPVNATSPAVVQFRLNVDSRVSNPVAITGVTFNHATRVATIGADVTAQELFGAYMFDLAQSGNMQYAEEWQISGTSLDFGAWDLTITNAYTGSIVTTGTATISGGSVSGTIIDSAADSFLSFSGVDSWIVYANETDQNANANALGSGTGSQTYRFNFSGGTTYYLRLTVSGETTLKSITPLSAGETEVSLQTAALLTSVNAVVTDINDTVKFGERFVYVNTVAVSNGDGTGASPFDNLDDGIDKYRTEDGFLGIKINSTTTNPVVPTKSCAGIKLIGDLPSCTINLNGQSFDTSNIQEMFVFGSQNASDTLGMVMTDCTIIGDLANFRAIMQGGRILSLTGSDITIQPAGSATLIGVSGISGGEVIIDLTNFVSAFNAFGVRDGDGIMIVRNMSVGTTSFEMDSGEVIFESSCTGGTSRNAGCHKVDTSAANGTAFDLDATIIQNITENSGGGNSGTGWINI